MMFSKGYSRFGVDGFSSTILKKSSLPFLITLGAQGINYFILIYLARLLGPTEYGIYMMAFAVSGLSVGLFTFNLHEATARFISKFNEQNDLKQKLNKYLMPNGLC